jgi:PAP2 superfamily C-terminal
MTEETWKYNWSEIRFRKQFAIGLILLGGIVSFFIYYLGLIEQRTGSQIEKGWMDFFCSPIDLSYCIFGLLYASILLGFYNLATKPKLLIVLIYAYALLLLLRMASLYFVALNPPVGIIPLKDPILQYGFYNGRENLNDLFFSGHVATVLLFAFISPNKKMRVLFLITTSIIGLFLVLQRVHYIMDVLAAPIFAFIAYYLSKKIVGTTS